ncbi:MAG: paraquat-inducible protein A, partial [Candidatus Rokuibacteriota bacterium]
MRSESTVWDGCRAIDVIGPWAMLDVFLLSVLVALVKL